MNDPLGLKNILKTSQAQGFSLVEVLVSILMIAGFLATAMQALVAATAIKVKSEEIAEATTWMQEDLEAIKFEANRLGFIDTNSDGKPDAYDPDFNRNGNSNDDCADGFADDLETELTRRSLPYKQNSQAKESAIGGRNYTLERVLDASNNTTLKIDHEVFDSDGDSVGILYSEVVPDVTFSCP
jgi:type II secretory pathway pseudopilin PulG